MNFGKWIVVAFIFFAGFIATLVTVCVCQDVPLVTGEYYKEELKYQEQIDRLNNAGALTDIPVITINKKQLQLDYSLLPMVRNARVSLFRPSDPRLDQDFIIQESSATSQTFEIRKPQAGLYRAKMTWEQAGKEYYIEKVIVL
jgi:hypothetical protein